MKFDPIFLFETAKDQKLFIYNHPYTLEPVHSLVIINNIDGNYWYTPLQNQIQQGRVMPGFEHLFIQVR